MITARLKLVWDRHHRADERTDKTGSIELRISLDGKHKYISTGISVQKKWWDDKNQIVVGILEATEYNVVLSQIKADATKVLLQMREEGLIDLSAIGDRMKVCSHNMTFLEFIELRIKEEERTIPFNTLKGHKSFLRRMKVWGKIRFFADINAAKIKKMEEWLKEQNFSEETIYGYHKHLRKFTNDAMAEGFIKENPYTAKAIKLHHGPARVHAYVTEEELKKIVTVELKTDRLRKVRDLFVFQAYTGMAYVDIMSFDFTEVKKQNGVLVLDGRRHKTGVPYHFVILNEAKKILKEYDYKLPKLSNQKYNDALKTLAEKCEIDKPISSHWARRTAGMIMLNNGVPIGIVSRILGHASTRTTEQAYAYLLDKTIDDAMLKFGKKMNAK